MINTLEKINKIALRFLEPLTAEETYAVILKEAVVLIGVDYGSIMLEQQGELKRIFSTSPIAFNARKSGKKKGLSYQSFADIKVLVAGIAETGSIYPELKKLGIQSTIYIPLSYHEKTIGVLILDSTKKIEESAIDLSILKLFGSMVSLAIRKAQLYDETKKALEIRDLFISMAAHEFRTPLTTISGYTQLLYTKLSGSNTPESRWVEELSWEALRLTQLVNELLAVNRIKTGELQYIWRECSIRNIIQRAIMDIKFNYPDHKVIFNDHLGANKDLLIGDFDKLLQVIINLLDNAAKFSPPEKDISVDLKFKKPHFVLDIEDQGKGITKKDFPRVFEGFYKGGDRLKEGMGIGLFLAKNIITQHHGSISIHSKPNKGTAVKVVLPMAKI